MGKLEKIVNGVYLLSGVMLLLIVIMSMSSCGSSKGCDGKKKFKTEMN